MYMRIYALHKRRLSTPSHAKHYNSHGRRSRGFPRWICRTSNVASRRSFLTTTRGSQRRHVLARRRVESSKRASGDIQEMRAKISLRVREGLHPKSLVLRVWARWGGIHTEMKLSCAEQCCAIRFYSKYSDASRRKILYRSDRDIETSRPQSTGMMIVDSSESTTDTRRLNWDNITFSYSRYSIFVSDLSPPPTTNLKQYFACVAS